MTELAARQAVLHEAESWLATPFHLGSRLKGVGVDCAQFLLACYGAAGIALDINPGPVSRDWFMHHEDERIISAVQKHAREVETPQPGDIVLYFIGKSWAHGAIVHTWPLVVQAKWNSGVQLADSLQGDLKRLPRKFFSPWAPANDPATVKHMQEAAAEQARRAFDHHV